MITTAKQLDKSVLFTEELQAENDKLALDIQNISSFLSTKLKENNNAESYLEEMRQKRDELETRIVQIRMREERTRNKLKFFKAEQTGFDVTKKMLENVIDRLKAECKEHRTESLKYKDLYFQQQDMRETRES